MDASRYIAIVLILFAINTFGQDSTLIKNYNQNLLDLVKGTDLERDLISDSVQFELRLWICDFFYPDKLIQLTKDIENIWDYRLGYFKFIDTKTTFVFQDSIKKTIDWDNFKIELDRFINAGLPNQNDIELTLIKDGKTFRMKNEDYFSSIMDGGAYTVEIFDNKTHKSIHYNNPESYLEKLKEFGLSTIEHEKIIRFTHYITDSFDFRRLQQIQMREIVDCNKNEK